MERALVIPAIVKIELPTGMRFIAATTTTIVVIGHATHAIGKHVTALLGSIATFTGRRHLTI